MKKIISILIEKTQLIIGYCVNIIAFKHKKANIGQNNKFYGKIKVYGGKNRITIGNNCIIRSGLSTNPLGGSTKTIFKLGPKGRIRIGNNVGISNSCLPIDSNLVIEDYVNIGGDVKIYDSDMHSINYLERTNLPDRTVKVNPITIKEGAWIGAHSIILKGVIIGKRSVIGAGSVVTKNVPDDEVWAGNPAKFIKKINNGDVK